MENQEPKAESGLSFGGRLMNVFASPSEAFEGIAAEPSKTKFWIIPWLAMIILGTISMFIMFSNPTLKQQIADAQARELQQRVEDGRMTQQQADAASDQLESMGGIVQIIGSIGVAFFITAYFFGGALVFWLVGKAALKSPEGYGTYLALYGTSAWIGVLGTIITMLMILGLSSLYATPSAALAVYSQYDPTSSLHRILTRLDVFAGWQAFVIGVGLGKITGKPVGTTLVYAMGLWVVWALGMGLLGLGG